MSTSDWHMSQKCKAKSTSLGATDETLRFQDHDDFLELHKEGRPKQQQQQQQTNKKTPVSEISEVG